MRAVIYCRVSTKEQLSNLSLPLQRKTCEHYCHKEGIEVDKVFMEEGESAKTVDRTQFQKMLEYCRQNKGRLEYVVVYSVNRFARSQEDHAVTSALLKKLGITLRSATEPINDTPMGKAMEGMLSVWAQLDNDLRAHRTKEGMQNAIREGHWTFKPPLGYRTVECEGPGAKIVPDPERAPLIKLAFELYATGSHSKSYVLDKVTALGLRTPRGRNLTAQTFDQTLRKAIYAGWMEVSGWNIRVRGKFEPLVSDEVFERVQRVLSGKGHTFTAHNRNNADFPLRVFVVCGTCGQPLTGSWSKGRSKKYAYYRCRNPKCYAIKVSKAELENHFRLLLERLEPKPEIVMLFKRIVLDVWRQKQGEAEVIVSEANRRVKELREKKNSLIDLLMDGRIDQDAYDGRMDKLNEDVALAEMALTDAKVEELDIEGALGFAEYLLGNAARLWAESSLEQKQRLQSVFFPQGLALYKDGFGTAVTSPLFNQLESLTVVESSLASPTGFEPVLSP